MSASKIGLQLYTLKDEFAADPFATLRHVAEIGFKGVEFVGRSLSFVDLQTLRSVLEETGLEVAGVVFEIDELENGLDGILRLCRSIDCPTVVVPSIRKEDCLSGMTIKNAALKMNYFATRCNTVGIAFLYHVHGIELAHIEGRCGLDWLMEWWDCELVRLEIDTYWVEHSGLDAVRFTKEYGNRCSSIHFKDMHNRQTRRDAAVGAGVIDMVGVAREGIENNVRWFIVEQEEFDGAPIESVKEGFRNLSRIRTHCIKQTNIVKDDSF
ncbi:MAG TPA: sugar phosphate isomerase/epimerase [Bacteroidota bacterium]